MYELTVRDHVLVAHSLTGEVFGPAQRLHGATYVVDATFARATLDDDGLVVDISRARAQLAAVLADLDHRNLDEVPELAGRNTTTEMLAGEISERLATRVTDGALGEGAVPGGPHGLTRITVTLHESHVAWAGHTREL